MNEQVARVIDVIRDNRVKFEAFCYALTPEELDRPVPDSTWIVRDFVAHLGTLDPAMDNWFADAASGITGAAPHAADGGKLDIDAFNDGEVAKRRDWPLKRVLDEAATNREALIGTMSRLTQAQIETSLHFDGDNKRRPGDIPLVLFLAGWAQHDPIHVADMLKGLPERASDPDLRTWIDNPFVAGYQKAMAGPPRT